MYINIHQIRNNFWLLKQKIIIFFYSNEFKNKINYFKASIFSIILGIIISFIFISINASNPIIFFGYIFKLAFHPLLKDQTLTYWSIYIIAGLSVSISFKAGLFNIGIPGQMLLAGSMTIIFGLKNPTVSKEVGIISVLLISIFFGAFLASIAAVLKAYFNVHEVVSTIMLNWIVWYIIKWLFMNPIYGLWNLNQNSTIDIVTISPNFNLILNGQTWIIPFIITILLLIIIVFIMNYTVIGFKIKTVGKSKNVSLYAGINVKLYIIISMALSGALSGILGMLYYMTQSTVLQFSTDTLPVIGFDAISVALVAFTNSFAILPIALLWGIIKTSALQTTQLPDFQISKQIGQLIFGIIIYINSISNLFIYFKPIFLLRRWWNIKHNKELNKKYKEYLNKIKNINKNYKIKIQELKNKFIKKEFKTKKNDINNELILYIRKIKNLKKEINFFKNSKYKELIKKGKQGIKMKYKLSLFISICTALDHFVQAKNDFLLKKQEIYFLKNQYYQYVLKLKGQIKQKLLYFYNFPKRKLYNKLIYLQSKYNSLLLKKEENIKKLHESYYPVFNKIKQKYLNNFEKLKKEEVFFTKKINKEIKKLNFKQRREIYHFKKINYKKIKKIKQELKIINNKIKKDFIFKNKIYILKQNLKLQLKNMKKKYCIKYKIINKKRKINMSKWKNELNKKLNHIIKTVSEDNKILKLEYYRKINIYQIKKGEKN